MADVHAADKAMEEQYKKMLSETNKAYSSDLAQLNITHLPFLRLPAELRIKVYSYIFTKKTYHITISADNRAKLSQKNTAPPLAPLTICRQIYDEAEKLRYAQTTFLFETRAFVAMGQSGNVAMN
ncbi:hypothetical protein N0V94_003921 [Neodidymelliopsis sp. IMI 364377]|nr:hypothetical protein N0V94_003921 [Neodidymelliopsis sp. IMI 364377]